MPPLCKADRTLGPRLPVVVVVVVHGEYRKRGDEAQLSKHVHISKQHVETIVGVRTIGPFGRLASLLATSDSLPNTYQLPNARKQQ